MQGAPDDERPMTIVEEPRRELIWVMASWIVGATVAFVFNGSISESCCIRTTAPLRMRRTLDRDRSLPSCSASISVR